MGIKLRKQFELFAEFLLIKTSFLNIILKIIRNYFVNFGYDYSYLISKNQKHLEMKSLSFKIMAILLGSLLFTNCATIIHGTKQDVSISSNPSKAVVTIDNVEKGITPVTVELSRKDHHMVQIKLDGFMPYETKFTRKTDGWIAGNIVFGGLIGLAVDAITGGMYKLTPDQLQAELRNQTASVRQDKNGIFLTVVLQPDSNWEKIGQLVRAN